MSRRRSLPLARLAWIIAAATLLGAAAPLPRVPFYRQFGRWLVACDNTRACVAKGFDEATRAELDLTRSAGDTKPSLALSAEDPINAGVVRLDGKPLALMAPAWAARDGVLSASDPAAVDAFVAAVRNGGTITLDAAPAKDDQPRTVPLDGFTAALLLVDAVQGRPGTPTALIAARGSAVPPPEPPLRGRRTICPKSHAKQNVSFIGGIQLHGAAAGAAGNVAGTGELGSRGGSLSPVPPLRKPHSAGMHIASARFRSPFGSLVQNAQSDVLGGQTGLPTTCLTQHA